MFSSITKTRSALKKKRHPLPSIYQVYVLNVIQPGHLKTIQRDAKYHYKEKAGQPVNQVFHFSDKNDEITFDSTLQIDLTAVLLALSIGFSIDDKSSALNTDPYSKYR